MRILVIDNVNYEDYPTGGILNFYRNMLPAFGNDLLLAGITTDAKTLVGRWTRKKIDGKEYDYFSMAKVTASSKRPLIPERIKNCIYTRKYIRKILDRNDFDIILTQKPEVIYFFPDRVLNKTCYILPGVGNPLLISRYPLAHHFAKIYDKFFFMPKAAKARWLLAAADYEARDEFAKRSNGMIEAKNIIQFPTRYDDKYYYMDNTRKRKKGNIFVTVGRLGWFKGWKLMIDAFKIVSKKNKDSEFHFIGDGEDEKKINNYIRTKDLEGKVFCDGKKTPAEIGKILNDADVFVMGSMREGWSTTLVEACACGVPCVVSDFSSSKEMISDGKNGFVVVGRDEKEFAKKMLMALELDRLAVMEYDKRFSCLAVSNLKNDLLNVLNSCYSFTDQ